MFWKSKEEREQERIQREKDEAVYQKNQARLREEETQRIKLIEELINIPATVGTYATEVFTYECALSGRAFTEGAKEVFFLDVVSIVIAFARANGGFSSDMVEVLLNVGSGGGSDPGHGPRWSKPISPDMYELKGKTDGTSRGWQDSTRGFQYGIRHCQ